MAFGCGRSSISALRSGARVPGPSCWARRRPCWNQDAYCTVPPSLRSSHASAIRVDKSASVRSGRGCPTLATAVSHPAEAATASALVPILGGISSGADDPPPPAAPSAAAPPAPEARAGGPWTRRHNAVHYAVVGAGLAGVATAWQLLRRSPRGRPVVLDLYDAAGIAAGGSGAAAGLLHPYNPRGKLLWRGEEAMAAALELVAAAEAAPAAPPPSEAEESPASGKGRAAAAAVDGSRGQYQVRRSERFVWPTGLVRPAANPKQAADFARSVAAAAAAAASAGGGGAAGGGTASATGAAASRSSGTDGGGGGGSGDGGVRGAGGGAAPSGLRVLSAAELQALVPGLMVTQRSEGSAAVAGTAAAGGGGEDEAAAAAAAAAAARKASAGVGEGSDGGPNRRARRAARAAAAADAAAATGSRAGGDVAGLLIPQGVVLDVGAYLRALWRACEVEAGARGDGSCVRLRLRRVTSLERLSWEEADEEAAEVPAARAEARAEARQYDAIVVAAGAAAATIEEVEAARLPLQLCQGLTLVMQPPQAAAAAAQPTAQTQTQTPPQTLTLATPSQDPLTSAADPQRSPSQPTAAAAPAAAAAAGYGYPAGSPSLLGQPYLAAQGRTRLVVGATKSYGWSPEAALAACGRSEYADAAAEGYGRRDAAGDAGDVTAAGAGPEASEVLASASTKAAAQAAAEAVETLRSAAVGVWSPLADWRVTAVREGVRALPPRTTHGSLPLLGRLSPGRPWWLVAGLGSRGLVYHGWLGRLIVDAVLYDSEGGIPAELTAWRDVAASAAVFEAP